MSASDAAVVAILTSESRPQPACAAVVALMAVPHGSRRRRAALRSTVLRQGTSPGTVSSPAELRADARRHNSRRKHSHIDRTMPYLARARRPNLQSEGAAVSVKDTES